jgi:hypothetical protein
LNTQDKRKLSLIHHLDKTSQFDDIINTLKRFNDSLVRSLSYLGKPKSSQADNNGAQQRKQVKRSIDSVSSNDEAQKVNVKVQKTKVLSTPAVESNNKQQATKLKTATPQAIVKPTTTKPLLPIKLEGYTNFYKVPLSKEQYAKLVAPRFKTVPLHAYLPGVLKKVR